MVIDQALTVIDRWSQGLNASERHYLAVPSMCLARGNGNTVFVVKPLAR